MRISVGEIKDYIKCPLYYKFVHIDNLGERKTIDDFYKEYLKLSIYYFYFSAIEKKIKSFDSILRKWESLWFTEFMEENFPEDELKTRSNSAIMLLNEYYKKIAVEKFTPIAVNFPFETLFPGDEENVHITGDIDLIKILNDRTRQSETQIVRFTLSRYYEDDFILRGDIITSIISHAFRFNFKSKEDKIVFSNIAMKKDTQTVRSGSDYVRAEKTVRRVCNGIKNSIFYPNMNKINCSHCSFKLFCLNEKSLN